MIYIVCWIHSIYWLGTGNDFLRSISLFEMPVIFYISGASYSLSRQKNLRETLINRFKRIYIPYYLYVIAWLPLILLFGKTNTMTPECWIQTILGASFLQPPVQQTHIWFIIPYMVISCSLPFQSLFLKKIPSVIYLLISLILFIIVKMTTNIEVIQHFICYNIFFILGYVSWRKWKINKLILFFGGIILSLGVLYHTGSLLHMQGYKFPPHLEFILFGLGMLGVMVSIFPHLHLKNNKLLQIWNKYGYSIYLWQIIPSIIIYCISKTCNCPSSVSTILFPMLLFIMNTGLCLIVTKYEKIAMRCIDAALALFKKQKA